MSELCPVTCDAEVRGPAGELRMACRLTAPPGAGLLVIDSLAWLQVWARRQGLELWVAAIDPAFGTLVEFCGLDAALHCERDRRGRP